jgi:hypothetical protein
MVLFFFTGYKNAVILQYHVKDGLIVKKCFSVDFCTIVMYNVHDTSGHG